jgi:hypothetical protein
LSEPEENPENKTFPTANAVGQKEPDYKPVEKPVPREKPEKAGIVSANTPRTVEIIPVSQPPPKNRGIQLADDQMTLFHAAKACFETSEKAKAIMYQDKRSTQMHMENLKLFVVRCVNIAPGITADFMLNVLDHFRVVVNSKLRGKAEFTPRALITPWIWEMVIGTLPENDVTPELRESIRGMFK